MFLRQSWIAIRLARWTRSMREPTGAERQAIGVVGACRVKIAESGTSPFVTGCSRPLLVIPEYLLAGNRRRELLWVTGHEAGHLRGRDLQWLALFQAIRALFWWNPTVHCLVRLWAEAREQICDHLALAGDGDRREYISFLVSLGARRMSGIVMPMAARGTVARLKRRIGFLMEATAWRPCGRKFVSAGVLLTALAGVGVSQVGCRSATSGGAMTGAMIGGGEELSAGGLGETYEETVGVAGQGRNRIVFYGKFVISREPAAANGAVISDENKTDLLEKLAKTRGCEIHGMPIMGSENRQECVTQGTRELTVTPPRTPSAIREAWLVGRNPDSASFDDTAYRFTGVRFLTLPVVSGKDVVLDCRAAYGRYPGMKWTQGETPPSAEKVLDRVQISTAKAKAKLAARHWLCVSFGEIEPGRFGTLLVQPVPEDAAGLRTSDFSIHPPLQVRAKAWLVEGDDVLGGASSEYFEQSEVVERIRSATKGVITDLPTVTFESNRPSGQLWKGLPRFRLSVATRNDTITGIGYGSSPSLGGTSYAPGKTIAYSVQPAPGQKLRVLFFRVERQP